LIETIKNNCQIIKFLAKSIKLIWILLSLLNSYESSASDTTLIDFIHLDQSIVTITSDSTGKVWMTGGLGLQYWDGEKFVVEDPDYRGYIINVNGKIIDVDDYPYVKEDNGYYPWYLFSHWKKHLPLIHNWVSAAEDAEGYFWVAQGSNIYIFKVEDRFEKLMQGYSIRGIYSYEGDIFTNSYSGFYKNSQPIEGSQSFAQGRITKFNDKTIITAWDGLSFYDLQYNRLIPWYLNFNDTLADWHVGLDIYLARNIDDTTWICTNQGIGIIENDSIKLIGANISVEDFAFENGRFLLATNDGVWERIGNKTIQLSLKGIECKQILYNEGLFYFCSQNGIYIYDGDHFDGIDERHGLSDDETSSAILDDYGFLWVSTFSGLNRIDLQSRFISKYLTNTEFNKRSFHKSGDKLYFGSISGLYSFNSSEFLGDKIIKSETLIGKYENFYLIIIGFVSLTFFFLKVKSKKQFTQQKEEMNKLKRKNFILTFQEFVMHHDNIAGISVGHMAEYFGMSERTLYRLCHGYDIKPGELLKNTKLKKGLSLLKANQNISYKDVANHIGYSDQYFLNIFKEKYNMDLKRQS
jgi:AraC-like DNA-binding protein